ncbi:MarC family protein [uncultured Williamsia sp.]|uniref:MarC family protein n=1 Tax=uncultured Williamsia sp. TaxID=259311 RepID=UPI0026033094|nr:MarC family protein [uncultured Williamsia sp.]
MGFDVTEYTTVLITLVVIMDPPGQIPIFLSLVGHQTPAARNRAAFQAPAVSLLVISTFAIGGKFILAYLHIGVPALQGAGGLLLLLVALQLLTGLGNASNPRAADGVNVALVPLGTPLLAGPGAIAAVIVSVSQADDKAGTYLAIAAAIVTVHLILATVLRFSTVLIRILGIGGVTLLAKIAGLLLAAIAVQLIANSIMGFVASA